MTEHSTRMERAMEVEEDSPEMARLVSEEARERLAALKLVDERNAQLERALGDLKARQSSVARAERKVQLARNLLALAVKEVHGAFPFDQVVVEVEHE